jgi:hypothetical protein
VNIVDLISDTGRCLIGLSPADEIRIATRVGSLSPNDMEGLQAFVDKSCIAMSKRLDYLVDKMVTEIRETMKK